ncbi:MAG: DHA2 family efflux MFS transporter permease subunit [Nibricoccus sp.]
MSASAVLNPPIQKFSNKLVLPWLVAVALFMENLDATIINTAVPTMSASLGVDPLSLKAVLTSYTLSLAVFIPISGWMADRFGTKRIFLCAIALFTLGSLLCGLSVNIHMLVAARVLQGIGGAMMTPVGRLALLRSFPRSEMLTAMNYVVIPALIGPLLGPLTGGLIVHWVSWRFIFFVNIPFGLLGLWLTRKHMPDFRDEHVAPLDRTGFILFGAGIALLSYVLEIFGEHSWPVGPLSLLAAASLTLLGFYGWHAKRDPAPVLQLRLFFTRTFRISVVGGFVTRLGIGGMPFLLPLLYQIGLGYAPWQAGLLTMPTAAAAITMKLASRRILARFGYRTILASNTILLGANMMLFSLITAETPVVLILLLSFTQGFFASLQFTSMNSLVYADIDDRDASKAGSIASTAQQMSLSFGVATASLVASIFLGGITQADTALFVSGLHKAFLVLGGLTIISSIVFRGLLSEDGASVSQHRHAPVQAAATATEEAVD